MSTDLQPLDVEEVRKAVLNHFITLIADSHERTEGLNAILNFIDSLPDNHVALNTLATDPRARCADCGCLLVPDTELYTQDEPDYFGDSHSVTDNYVAATLFQLVGLIGKSNRDYANWLGKWIHYLLHCHPRYDYDRIHCVCDSEEDSG